MAQDLVSVIIPTHDRQAQLMSAVRSALSQSYGTIEVIVCDDASTPPISLPEQMRSDARMHLIRTETNIGPSAARVEAIRESSGTFLAFLDDDDEWFPEKIEKQIEVAKQAPEAAIIDCGFEMWDGDRLIFRYIPDTSRDLRKKVLTDPCLASSSVVVRRGAYEEVGGFDPSISARMEDWDLWIRLAQNHAEVALPEVLLKRRFNLLDPARLLQNRLEVIGRTRLLVDTLPEWERRQIYAHHDFIIGVCLAQLGRSKQARSRLWTAWKADPRKLRRLVHISRTFAGERAWAISATAARGLARQARSLTGRDPYRRIW